MEDLYKALIKLKGKQGTWGIVLLAILGVFLLVIPSFFKPREGALAVSPQTTVNRQEAQASSLSQLEHSLAQQVTAILSSVEGVGYVTVAVSLAVGLEKDYALNSNNEQGVIEEKDSGGGTRVTKESKLHTEVVFAQGEGQPVLIKELAPQIKGVVVVAEGAKNSEIKATITQAVQAMLDLPAHRVMVLPGKAVKQ